MDEDPGAELAELLAALVPDSIFRAIALALAVQIDTSRDHAKVMAVASAFHEFIDPFSDAHEPEITFTLEAKNKRS